MGQDESDPLQRHDRGHPPEKSIVALFDDAFEPDPGLILLPTPCEGITPRPTESSSLQTSLKSFPKEVRGRFDVTLIECPPNLHACSWNALLAAEFVTVPVRRPGGREGGPVAVDQLIGGSLARPPTPVSSATGSGCRRRLRGSTTTSPQPSVI